MANLLKDVVIDEKSRPKQLLLEKHVDYLLKYGKDANDFEFCTTEYLRMSGMYWVLTTLAVAKKLDTVQRDQFLDFIDECWDSSSGGYSACPGHDPHILYTLSAVQIAATLDAIERLPSDDIVRYVRSLQNPDGSFAGDRWGEVDTRFSFCAVATLALLGRLHLDDNDNDTDNNIDLESAVRFVLSCQNFDGGFGSRPNAESHAGLIYCCVGFLSVVRRLASIDGDTLAWWLSERQLPSGGLNGRPEKLPDVCYSWWVISSLTMLGRQRWIDSDRLKAYILASQDVETGGFSDRPGDLPDPFHTVFGVAALSLLGEPGLLQVSPTFCMPQQVIDRLGVTSQILS
ncbi:Geranylgeranyl transferase [Nesidiocoris tenuis]|uniref:Geranylgeranyl transferase type-2 subunit beta n=1 Tax=Nesidiocoris tenuis TaxID=355587 RepID=A0ABN7AUX5_9HEMI|nr:Geranylgeranyl transferase [Nesidiocoris tenuis]